jgi:hypothetical protein
LKTVFGECGVVNKDAILPANIFEGALHYKLQCIWVIKYSETGV